MANYEDDRTFIRSDALEPTKDEVVAELKRTRTEVLLNYMPVGSEQAARFYAECALEAGVAFINNMPVFIASNPEFAARFKQRNLPIIGDDNQIAGRRHHHAPCVDRSVRQARRQAAADIIS